AERLGASRPTSVGPLTSALRIIGTSAPVDVMFDEIAGSLSFQALRSRSQRVPVADQTAVVASLADVIASKAAADRPKDRAQLPILRDTLRVKEALAKTRDDK